MATETILVARIYLREGEHLLAEIMQLLHDQEQVAGVTVLRGIAGFGADGKLRTSELVALSLDLPLIVEFYDTPKRIERIVSDLKAHRGIKHIISWPAQSHILT